MSLVLVLSLGAGPDAGQGRIIYGVRRINNVSRCCCTFIQLYLSTQTPPGRNVATIWASRPGLVPDLPCLLCHVKIIVFMDRPH